MEYILLLFFHVGPMGQGGSNATVSIPHFKTEGECISAGNKSNQLVNGTVKSLSFTCLSQSK